MNLAHMEVVLRWMYVIYDTKGANPETYSAAFISANDYVKYCSIRKRREIYYYPCHPPKSVVKARSYIRAILTHTHLFNYDGEACYSTILFREH